MKLNDLRGAISSRSEAPEAPEAQKPKPQSRQLPERLFKQHVAGFDLEADWRKIDAMEALKGLFETLGIEHQDFDYCPVTAMYQFEDGRTLKGERIPGDSSGRVRFSFCYATFNAVGYDTPGHVDWWTVEELLE